MASQVSVPGILAIIQIALNALAVIPAVGPEAALAGVFINIVQSGMAAHHAATGAALDLTKLPLETPVA